MRIKEILKSKGMTVNELAEILDVSRQALSRQIQGKMLIETAERIANALNVPIWQLFISEEDVVERCSKHTYDEKSDFLAIFKQGSNLYSASSIVEARDVLDKLENKKEGK